MNLLANEGLKQAGDMLINACWMIAGIVLIMGIIAFAFLYFKMKIIKKLNNQQEETKPINSPLPYTLAKSILTNHELNFYKDLQPIASELGLVICPKVRVADFINVPQNDKNMLAWFNKISRKHVDYLLCDDKLQPVLAIELDDPSHDRKDRQQRDDFIDSTYKHVGLDVLHIRKWTSEELREQLNSKSTQQAQKSISL